MVSKEEMKIELADKASIRQLNEAVNVKLDQDTFYTAMTGKIKRTEVLDLIDEKIQHIQLQVDNLGFLRDDFASKSSLVDIVSLLDRKANSSDVTRELSLKVDTEEFLSAINEKVCTSALDFYSHIHYIYTKPILTRHIR